MGEDGVTQRRMEARDFWTDTEPASSLERVEEALSVWFVNFHILRLASVHHECCTIVLNTSSP
jgi:hypothetical protein